MVYESDEPLTYLNLEHNLGVIPIIQVFTKININDDYVYTLLDFKIDENELEIFLTEASYLKIVFKA